MNKTYRTESRFKPMREFLAHPAFHAAIGVLAAMAVIEWARTDTFLCAVLVGAK